MNEIRPDISIVVQQWTDLQHDFPPPTSVSYHDCKWAKAGTWPRVNDTLRARVREQAGRDPHPSAGAIDSQTTEAANTGGYRGYDREADSVRHGRQWDPDHRMLVRTDDRRVDHAGDSVRLSALHPTLRSRGEFRAAGRRSGMWPRWR